MAAGRLSWSLHMTPTVFFDPLPNAMTEAMSLSDMAPTLIVLLPWVGSWAAVVHVWPLSSDVL